MSRNGFGTLVQFDSDWVKCPATDKQCLHPEEDCQENKHYHRYKNEICNRAKVCADCPPCEPKEKGFVLRGFEVQIWIWKQKIKEKLRI